MKNIIAILLAVCLILMPGISMSAPSATVSENCECKNEYPLTNGKPGGGRGDPCINAAQKMKENNKIIEDATKVIALNAQQQANKEGDSIFNDLSKCIANIDLSLLEIFDFGGIDFAKIGKILMDAVCKMTKAYTTDWINKWLSQAKFETGIPGVGTIGADNINVLGIELASIRTGSKSGKFINYQPIKPARNLGWELFSNMSSMSGIGSMTGNKYLDNFINNVLQDTINQHKKP